MQKAVVFIKKNWFAWLLLLPIVLCLIIVKWYPIFEGIVLSFFKTKGYETVGFAGLQNYKEVLSDTMFLKTLLNTVKYVMWSLIIGAVPPLLLAMLLNEVTFINKFFRTATYIPYVVPGVAMALIWTQVYNPANYGLLNSILTWLKLPAQEWLQNPNIAIPLIVVVMTWQGAPGTSVIYLARLQEVRRDLYEAALIDGAGLWDRFKVVTFPKIASTFLLMIVQQIIGVFQVMELPMIMTGGGPNYSTLTLNLTSFNYAFTYMKVSKSLALGVCIFIMLIVVSIVYFKLEKKIKE